MMSAVKAGLKIVDVDINITEVEDVRAFLKASDCKVIFFKPEHGDHDYLLQLRKAIPEFFECKMLFPLYSDLSIVYMLFMYYVYIIVNLNLDT